MARFYVDNDIARRVVSHLEVAGHDALAAWDARLDGATDDEQFLFAVQQQRILLTHNERDFLLLHDAWRRWTQVWNLTESHSGILVVPQGMRYGIYWDADQISRTVLDLMNQDLPLVGELFRWKEGRWQRRRGRDWILP